MEGGSKKWKVEIDRSIWYQDRSQTTRRSEDGYRLCVTINTITVLSESWMEGGSKKWKVEIDRSTWYQDRSKTTRTQAPQDQ